ncbi:hypothetical protein [Salinicola tamaricis]|uniref:hypothetical protein n=1 Tax=Salinicola tamaricis TaxID=1771309 RepID=UPI000D09C847|nr:hypothetical protein [Salinicola tamaricis]
MRRGSDLAAGTGPSPLHDRLREATLHLINEMHHGSDPGDRERQQAHVDRNRRTRRAHGIRNASARQLMGSRLAEWLTPIRRITPDERQEHEDDEIAVSKTGENVARSARQGVRQRSLRRAIRRLSVRCQPPCRRWRW